MSVDRDYGFRRIAATLVDLSLEFWGGVLGSYFGMMVAALVTAMHDGAPEQMQHSVKSGFGIGFAFWAISVSIVNRVLIQGVSRASIGKKLFKLELISSGAPLTWSTVMTRWVISVGSLAAGGAGYIYAFFNAEQKTFHDLIADTDVIPIFEGSSMSVEYREVVFSNAQAERPMASVIALPVRNVPAAAAPAATGTDGVSAKVTLADVIQIESDFEDEKKVA